MTVVLLDTCAMIWMANGDPISPPARDAMIMAALNNGVLISPVSAWEIGLLSATGLSFRPDAKTWFSQVLVRPGIRLAPFSPEVAIDSTLLPGTLHRDPADRMLIATARALGVPLVTRDRKIIAYAEAGHLDVIPC